MSGASHDQHIRTILDRLDLFGFRVPVVIPADFYPAYLRYLEARSRGAKTESAIAEVSEA